MTALPDNRSPEYSFLDAGSLDAAGALPALAVGGLLNSAKDIKKLWKESVLGGELSIIRFSTAVTAAPLEEVRL